MSKLNDDQRKLYLAINEVLTMLENKGMPLADAIPVLEQVLREIRDAH